MKCEEVGIPMTQKCQATRRGGCLCPAEYQACTMEWNTLVQGERLYLCSAHLMAFISENAKVSDGAFVVKKVKK